MNIAIIGGIGRNFVELRVNQAGVSVIHVTGNRTPPSVQHPTVSMVQNPIDCRRQT